MRYCESPFLYRRRETRPVVIGDPARGGVVIGGVHPIVKQSMITCDTMDTAACVQQTLDLVAVGSQLVRITAPTVKDAANLQVIVAELRARDCHVPIVADIHFKPEAGLEAARWVEKVRINPGNYADSKKFAVKEYSDDQYLAELARIEGRAADLWPVPVNATAKAPATATPQLRPGSVEEVADQIVASGIDIAALVAALMKRMS